MDYEKSKWNPPPWPIPDSDRIYAIKKQIAIDELKKYLFDRAADAPVNVLIEDFVHENRYNAALYPRDTQARELFSTLANTAEDMSIFFL